MFFTVYYACHIRLVSAFLRFESDDTPTHATSVLSVADRAFPAFYLWNSPSLILPYSGIVKTLAG
jgi:hypothetical protein